MVLYNKITLDQHNREGSIARLVDIMNDVYLFVVEAEQVGSIPSQKRLVLAMAQQTIDCAYFIQDYATVKNFGKWV